MRSGVVREDNGVETFLGNIDGDLEDVRIVFISGCGCGGVFGIGGALCKIESRLALRASVGLTVLAPNPEACEDAGGKPGIVDIRFEEEDGVFVPLPLTLAGDFATKDDVLLCSGVPTFTERLVCPCLEGGWSDLVFAAREAVKPLAPSV